MTATQDVIYTTQNYAIPYNKRKSLIQWRRKVCKWIYIEISCSKTENGLKLEYKQCQAT